VRARSRGGFLAALGVATALLIHAPAAWAFWTPDGVPAGAGPGEQVTPVMVQDGAGGVIVVWSDSRPSTYDIYAQRLNSQGRALWAPGGVALCAAPDDQTNPQVVSDGSGGAIVVWQDARGGQLDIYAQRVDPDGRPLWDVDGIPLCTALRNQDTPVVATDGLGGAIVTWKDARAGDPLRDVFAQRVDGTGTIRWALDGVPFHSARVARPAITSDGFGGAYVAWEDSLSSLESEVQAQRIDAAGAAQWTSGGVALTAVSGIQTHPVVVRSGSGAIVVWEDHRAAVSAVYGQRVDLSGAVQWTANGSVFSSGSGDATNPIVTFGGAGEAIAAWQDYRNAGAPDLFAAKADSLGSLPWGAGGLAIETSSTLQLGPSIDSDRQGGALFSWYDFIPSVGTDIRAQHCDSLGQLQWPAGGAPVCTAFDNQSLPVILFSPGVGALVAWQDHRNGFDSDVYVGRVLSSGEVLEVTSVPLLRAPYPNPFNPATTLVYGVPYSSRVSLRIYDSSGRLVRSLLDQTVPAGINAQVWDGNDEQGRAVASGIYIAEFRSPGRTESRKMALVR
jgi:hypothetical protein